MKYLVVALCLVLSAPAFAQDPGTDATGVQIGAGGGITFEAGPASEDPDISLALEALFNALKVGVFGDLQYYPIRFLGVGAHAGFFFFPSSDDEGDSGLTPLIDVPLRATVTGTLGNFSAQAYCGYNLASVLDLATDNGLGIRHKFEIGLRGEFAGLYVEASRLYWTNSGENLQSSRYGLGYRLRFL